VLCPGTVLKLGADLLPVSGDAQTAEHVISSNGHSTGASASLEDVEKNHILDVLKQTRWVIEGPRGAAKVLNLHPNTLRSRLKKLGIERASAQSN
jgi:formate hydrogenlyase transcriptional activator